MEFPQRLNVQLSERRGFLIRALIKNSPNTPRASQQYGAKGFKRGTSSFSEKRAPVGQRRCTKLQSGCEV